MDDTPLTEENLIGPFIKKRICRPKYFSTDNATKSTYSSNHQMPQVAKGIFGESV
jgi:hypothetical protein